MESQVRTGPEKEERRISPRVDVWLFSFLLFLFFSPFIKLAWEWHARKDEKESFHS
jgi:hypothetical protein